MALNYLDVEDAEILAQEKVRRMMEDFQQRFYRPMVDTRASMVLGTAAQQIDPKIAKRLQQAFGGE